MNDTVKLWLLSGLLIVLAVIMFLFQNMGWYLIYLAFNLIMNYSQNLY